MAPQKKASYHHKVEPLKTDPSLSLSCRGLMNKGRRNSQTSSQGICISSRKVQSSAALPSSSPTPLNQRMKMFIKDERPTNLPPPAEVKTMLNQDLRSKAPPLRPTLQLRPTGPSHLPRPNQVQVRKLMPYTSVPTSTDPGLKRKTRDDESSGPLIKKPLLGHLFCQLCQVSCSSGLTMQQHLKGRPHKAKMEFMKLKRTGEQQNPRCDVCQIWCSDRAALEMHFKGQKHKSNVQALELFIERGGQKSSKEPILCQLCCVPCMSQELYKMHLKGKKHANKERELKAGRFN